MSARTSFAMDPSFRHKCFCQTFAHENDFTSFCERQVSTPGSSRFSNLQVPEQYHQPGARESCIEGGSRWPTAEKQDRADFGTRIVSTWQFTPAEIERRSFSRLQGNHLLFQ
jgi:hypothetical protein